MYVCLCHGLTEKHIKNILDSGEKSLKRLQIQCNAGTDCGSCIKDLKEMVRNCSTDNDDVQDEAIPTNENQA